MSIIFGVFVAMAVLFGLTGFKETVNSQDLGLMFLSSVSFGIAAGMAYG